MHVVFRILFYCGVITALTACLHSPRPDDDVADRLCPATAHLFSLEGGQFSAADTFFLSLSELNGFLDGQPRLTFHTNATTLGRHERACLDLLASLYVEAARLMGLEEQGREKVALRFIGHASREDELESGFRLSQERAFAEGRRVQNAIWRSLGWAPEIQFEGRGRHEPWWCEPGDNDCGLSLINPGSGEPENGGPTMRPDSRLEVRFDGASISGPRLGSLYGQLQAKQVAEVQMLRSRFVERPRYYPVGTAPLHPVILPIGPELSFKQESGCEAPADWFDSGWVKGPTTDPSYLEPNGVNASQPFDEASIFARLSLAPIVDANASGPKRGRLVLRLATGLFGPDGAQDDAADGVAGPRTQLGVGVPAYWRVRFRLEEMVSQLQLTEELVSVLDNCWGGFTEETFARFVKLEALDRLPRDFDGLLGHAYDFNRAVRTFGLRAGHVLQIDAGRPGPLAGRDNLRQNLSSFSTVQRLDLFAAPLALRRTPPSADLPDAPVVADGVLSSALWPARSGPYGHRSVTLNPALQSVWQQTKRSTDLEPRQLPHWNFDKAEVAFHLANRLALERFLRGRVVQVLSPGPRPGAEEEFSIDEDRLAMSAQPAADEQRDTVLIAAETPDILDRFLKSYRAKSLVNTDNPFCNNDLFKGDVLCGFFRHAVHLNLLVDVNVNQVPRQVPVDTRIGALMRPEFLASCFERDRFADPPDADFVPFGQADRLKDGVQIVSLGADLDAPAFYNPNDCRLLALPLLGGGRVSW